MARTLPAGSGDGDPLERGRGKRHKGRKPRAHHPRAKHPHPHQRKPAQRRPTPEPASARSAWPHAAGAPGAVSPLTPLDPASLAMPEPLALVGAERGGVHDALTAWGRQRDQALNRVWRRPGGLARLAGI